MQVREELAIDEVDQIVAGERGVVVELARRILGRCPLLQQAGSRM